MTLLCLNTYIQEKCVSFTHKYSFYRFGEHHKILAWGQCTLIVDLIGELVGKDVSKILQKHSSYQILDDELREDLKEKLSETA